MLYFWKDAWRTLNELMGDDEIVFHGAKDDGEAFKIVRVEYGNGLTVTVNRSDRSLNVPATSEHALTLLKDGWVGAFPDGSVLVYSGIGPLAKHRIDFAEDKARGIRFINPRGIDVAGVARPTLWLDGKSQSY